MAHRGEKFRFCLFTPLCRRQSVSQFAFMLFKRRDVTLDRDDNTFAVITRRDWHKIGFHPDFLPVFSVVQDFSTIGGAFGDVAGNALNRFDAGIRPVKKLGWRFSQSLIPGVSGNGFKGLVHPDNLAVRV